MDLEKELRKRLAAAVNECIKPPVLIGPKWLRRLPGGKPAEFQFLGVPRIAKATGKSRERIARMLLRSLDLSGLNLRTSLAGNGNINIHVGADAPPASPATKPSPTPPPTAQRAEAPGAAHRVRRPPAEPPSP